MYLDIVFIYMHNKNYASKFFKMIYNLEWKEYLTMFVTGKINYTPITWDRTHMLECSDATCLTRGRFPIPDNKLT